MTGRRDTPPPTNQQFTPLGQHPLSEFEAQRALISHQLDSLSRGVDRLNDFLGNIRVENAHRDEKHKAHDSALTAHAGQITALREQIESVRRDLDEKLRTAQSALEGKIKTAQDALDVKIAPLSEVNTQSKPVIKIVLYVLGTAATFGLGGLAHYAFGGH